MTARLIREPAAGALVSRARINGLDRELEALFGRHHRLLAIRLRSSRWRRHRRDAALILSLPGMGVVLAKSRSDLRDTAELIAEADNLSRFRSADALASTAGMAPVLRQSGRTRFLRWPNGRNKGLKRVFYQPAFCSLSHDDIRARVAPSLPRTTAPCRTPAQTPARACPPRPAPSNRTRDMLLIGT